MIWRRNVRTNCVRTYATYVVFRVGYATYKLCGTYAQGKQRGSAYVVGKWGGNYVPRVEFDGEIRRWEAEGK